MNDWLLLVLSLATENATVRMRVWRALKNTGAAVLRDGVYLLPQRPPLLETLQNLAVEVRSAGGLAWVLSVAEPEAGAFVPLFDRRSEYAQLRAEIVQAHTQLRPEQATETFKQTRQWRKSWRHLTAIDFFPGPEQSQTERALQDLEQALLQVLSPGEPQAVQQALPLLDRQAYQGRVWATRQRPWVDRLASAWLIRRWIDPQARLLWLAQPSACPAEALGFDFDGARFTHVGTQVTFEVLLASFGLTGPGLQRLAALVHVLDVGGVPIPEAAGLEAVLAGLRTAHADDDALLQAAEAVFDALWQHFEQQSPVAAEGV